MAEELLARMVVEAVAKGFENLTSQYQDQLTKMSEAEKKASKETEELNRKLKEQDDAMRRAKLGATVLAGGLTILGVAGVKFAVNAVQLAARVEVLGTVMETVRKQTGASKVEVQALEEALKEAGITTQVARGAIIDFMKTNVDLAKAVDLARVAQNAAVVAGLNSSQTLDRLIHGMQTFNPLILRNIGLFVDFQGAFEAQATEAGKLKDELSDTEKQTAALNAVIASGAEISNAYTDAMEDAGKKVTSLDRHVEESVKIFGDQLLPVYESAIDAATDLLKAWQDMEPGTQAAIATTIAYGSALAAASGSAFLFISRLEQIKLALIGVRAVLATTAGAALGVVSIFGALFVGIAARARQLEAERLHLAAVNEELIQSKSNYKDYQKALREAAEEQGAFVITQAKMDSLLESGNRKAIAMARQGLLEISEASHRANRDIEEGLDLWILQQAEMAKAARVTEEYRQTQDELSQAMSDLDIIVSGSLEQTMADYSSEVDILKDEAADLIVEIEKLEKKTWLSTEDKEELKGLRSELSETEKAITSMADEHDDATARILFNLITQRAALNGLTSDELTLVNQIAQDWGLIDQATATALASIDQAFIDLEQGGNIDLIIAKLGGLKGAIDSVAGTYDIVINSVIHTPAAGQSEGTRIPTGNLPTPPPEPGGTQEFASGGLLKGSALVGEKGTELILKTDKGFLVVPADLTRELRSLGFGPERKMQAGGFLLDSSSRGDTPTPPVGPSLSGGSGTASVIHNHYYTVGDQLDIEEIVQRISEL